LGSPLEIVYGTYPIGSMYAIYGNIYHQYTPNVSIYAIHGSYGYGRCMAMIDEHIMEVPLKIICTCLESYWKWDLWISESEATSINRCCCLFVIVSSRG
jgi:hypothetical protein